MHNKRRFVAIFILVTLASLRSAAASIAGSNFTIGRNLKTRGRSSYTRGWKLLWHDEFEGTNLDSSKWGFEIGDGCSYGICGWGNSELQYYTNRSENVYVSNGLLHIVPRHEAATSQQNQLVNFCRSQCGSDNTCKNRCKGTQFSSARLRTLGKFSMAPGMNGFSSVKLTARLKVTPGTGMWPALWMLPEPPSSVANRCSGCGKYGQWPSSGEIDVFEATNDCTSMSSNIHYGGPFPNNDQWVKYIGFDPNQWHTVTLVWKPTSMQFYLDGKMFHSALSGRGNRMLGWFSPGGGPNSPFDQKFYILLDVALGGGLTGDAKSSDVASMLSGGGQKSMLVDWIRVYGH